MDTLRYNYAQRLLHWLIALLVFGLLAVGSLLGTLGFEGLKDLVGLEMTNQLYGYHKTFGILLLTLMVLRLALKRLFRSPPYQPPLTGLERAASVTIHSLLYAALILMPVLGWLGTAAGGAGGSLPSPCLLGITGDPVSRVLVAQVPFALYSRASPLSRGGFPSGGAASFVFRRLSRGCPNDRTLDGHL